MRLLKEAYDNARYYLWDNLIYRPKKRRRIKKYKKEKGIWW